MLRGKIEGLQGVLASVASQEWQMLEVVGQFGLQYNDQT